PEAYAWHNPYFARSAAFGPTGFPAWPGVGFGSVKPRWETASLIARWAGPGRLLVAAPAAVAPTRTAAAIAATLTPRARAMLERLRAGWNADGAERNVSSIAATVARSRCEFVGVPGAEARWSASAISWYPRGASWGAIWPDNSRSAVRSSRRERFMSSSISRSVVISLQIPSRIAGPSCAAP